jgi:hypothetical protein
MYFLLLYITTFKLFTGGVGAPGGDAFTGLYGQYKILSSLGTVSWTTTSATAHNGSIAVVNV